MKMKKMFSVKTLAVILVSSVALLYSCKKDSDSILSATDVQSVNSESVSASYTSETADMSSSVTNNITNTQMASGREDGQITGLADRDGRLTGAVITITPGPNSTKDNPNGTITINFGTGKTDPQGVVRKGLITITYSGLKWKSGSTRSLTFSDYYRNDIKIEGTYTVTNVSDSTANPMKFEHKLDGGKITFKDGKTVTRSADIIVGFTFENKILTTITHYANAVGTATGIASGTDRNSKSYTMTITNNLVYKVSCMLSKVFIPVTGEKTFLVVDPNSTNTAGTLYTINYGSGDCDNTVTVSVSGKSKDITVSSDGN